MGVPPKQKQNGPVSSHRTVIGSMPWNNDSAQNRCSTGRDVPPGAASSGPGPGRFRVVLLGEVASVEQLFDLALEQRFDLHAFLERDVLGLLLEQVLVQVEVLQVHLR